MDALLESLVENVKAGDVATIGSIIDDSRKERHVANMSPLHSACSSAMEMLHEPSASWYSMMFWRPSSGPR